MGQNQCRGKAVMSLGSDAHEAGVDMDDSPGLCETGWA